MTLNNDSEWATVVDSTGDRLSVNKCSQVEVTKADLTSATMDLTKVSSLKMWEAGCVAPVHLTIEACWSVGLTESTG
ncbi:hypothetical protein, partial [Salmonella enterica]|uniref:hypothetical protein n=1 Tax=Salmonella enterica TaxID=28901 RepID=UPI00398C2F04